MADRTVLAIENIEGVRAATNAYMSETADIFNRLQGVMAGLVSQDFIGRASNGYEDFFAQITPALRDKISQPETSLPYKIQMLAEMVSNKLIGDVDLQLETHNRQAAGQ